MKTKQLLLGWLAVGTGLALVSRRAFAGKAPANPAGGGSSHEAVDAYVGQQMRRLRIPGAALAIIEGDRIVHLRGFGRARPDGEVPTPQTPFVLGSTTKSITALAVMQLMEAGSIELDAPVQRYLSWFRVADPEASARMTVRHLLNQTSGLSMVAGMVNLANLDDDPGAAERQARALSTQVLARQVGIGFEYSNLNYNLLGLVVEAASREPYAAYVRRHIFEPLAMRHSYASKAEAQRDNLAVGHRHWFGRPVPAPDLPLSHGSIASGQLISCSEDMAHYLVTHLNGGRFDGHRILSEAGVAEMHRGEAEQRVMGSLVASYGMGWFVNTVGGTKLISHGGNVPDFASFMGLLPEKRKGFVLLFNADPWGLPFVIAEVGEGAAAVLAGGPPPTIRLGFIPWVMRAQPLLPLLQIAGVLSTLRQLRRWRARPAFRTRRGVTALKHLLLPLLPHLSLAALPVYLRSSGLLRYMDLYMPDFAWLARISGGFAALWAIVRTGLVLRAMAPRPHRRLGGPPQPVSQQRHVLPHRVWNGGDQP
ncbi:MAG TPA: serine hydrolase domain-containing protein [Anaerolineales bacterium]|nr:serine hydrolase domain-containing protein [Anaerolineales bacterium]